ncbi:MAG: CxxxxCH/CxxCH domain-containing protein [Nitrospirae bacterium]|nr:CxxxxCH/CxxCH domain-containing protein [Nitrospirota bacterium]
MGRNITNEDRGMNLKKPKISLILIFTIIVSIFIGYSPKQVQAAAAFQAAGTAAEGTTSISPVWPAHAVGDIALLFVETAGGSTISLTTPNGFIQAPNSPQTTGSGTAGTKIYVYWARATSTSMAAPTVATTADHIYAVILTYRGVTGSGNPFDITGGGVKATASTSVTATGVTTTVPDTLIVVAVANDLDSAAAVASGWTNANLTGITERRDAGTIQGLGGGIAVMDGTKATAGATGNTTLTVTSSINAFLTISLIPNYEIGTCAGCHGFGATYTDGTARNTPAGRYPGSHSKHVVNYGKVCSVCHVAPATETSADYKHQNATITMANPINGNPTAAYTKGTSWAQTNSPTAFTGCTNTYCHSNGTSVISGTIPANTSATWAGTTTCQSCHGAGGNDDGRPNYANNTPKRNTHGDGASYGVTHKATACPTCHTNVSGSAGAYTVDPATHANGSYNIAATLGYTQATGVCSTPGCHGSATWGGNLSCTECHAAAINSPVAQALDGTVTQRRAITTEFAQASSHVRSRGSAVTNNDCGVCHMEGTASTGAINATYHKNGYVDLRDPDTGNQIQTATWGGTGAGSYTTAAPNVSFVRFSRNLSSATLETPAVSVMINQCLKCHDSGGAVSTSAQVPSGTALKPFNTTVSGNPSGNVLDLYSQFLTTNSSYHPILGKQNNSYADIDRMAAPWNGVTKTSATTTGWGPLITCWDCHAPNSATGTITSTVTAHGSAITSATGTTNAVELRGYVWRTGTVSATNNTTLCIVCHSGYDTSTVTHHGTTSALSANTNNGMTLYLRYACYYCHSSGTTKPARPLPSDNVHGTNALPTGGGTLTVRWLGTSTGSPARVDTKPYAFIRNTTQLSDHSPASIAGSTYSANCNMRSTDTYCNQGLKTYTVGGTY